MERPGCELQEFPVSRQEPKVGGMRPDRNRELVQEVERKPALSPSIEDVAD